MARDATSFPAPLDLHLFFNNAGEVLLQRNENRLGGLSDIIINATCCATANVEFLSYLIKQIRLNFATLRVQHLYGCVNRNG